MTSFAINLVTNPSAELDLSGYTAVGDVVMAQDFSNSLFGSASVNVTTSGALTGQGMYTPAGDATLLGPTTYSASLHIQGEGTGTVNVQAIYNPGGVVKRTVAVAITEDWQRVTLDNLAIPSGNGSVYLLVTTPSAEVLNFWIDGVQVEENPASTEYCDGDQYGCVWDGTPHASISERPVQFLASSDASNDSDGTLFLLVPGEAFFIAASGENFSDGSLEMQAVDKVAVF